MQIAVGSPMEKRDVGVQIPAAEVTTESFLKSLQKGVDSVFSSDNVDVSFEFGIETESKAFAITES